SDIAGSEVEILGVLGTGGERAVLQRPQSELRKPVACGMLKGDIARRDDEHAVLKSLYQLGARVEWRDGAAVVEGEPRQRQLECSPMALLDDVPGIVLFDVHLTDQQLETRDRPSATYLG